MCNRLSELFSLETHTLKEELTHIVCTSSHIMHTDCKVGRISHMSAFLCMHTPTGRPPLPASSPLMCFSC